MTTAKTLLAASLASLFLTGCSSYEYDKNFFDYDREQSRTRKFLDAQIAKGAAEEAAMRGHHFKQAPSAAFASTTDESTAVLNSLGHAKLDAILNGRQAGEPLTVYVDADEANGSHVEAVANYLLAAGLDLSEFDVEIGDATMVMNAGDAMAGLKKQKGSGASTSGGGGDAGGLAGGLFGGE